MSRPEGRLSTRPLRHGSAIGLCLLLVGMLSPMVAAADTDTTASTPTSAAPNTSTEEATSTAANTPAAPRTATTSYPLVDADFSLAISPTRLVIGQTDIGSVQQVQVINRGRLPATVTVEKRNFTVGLDGSMQFLADAPFSASDWVTVSPATFDVASGSAQAVTVTVQVAADPEPGDHQVALVFLVPSEDTGGNIRVNKGIGMPTFVTVPGPVDDSVILNSLSAPGFSSGGTVDVTATLTNTGTVHHDFRGDAPLAMAGAGSAAPFPDFTVARGLSRTVTTTWDPPLICICHPSVTFTNADGRVQTASVRVIVFPVYLVGGLVLAIGLVLVGIRLARRRSRASVGKGAHTLKPAVLRGDA